MADPAVHLDRGQWQRQLLTYKALVVALDRSGEVLAAIASCEDKGEAEQMLMALLQVDAVAATAVLDMQWGVMTAARRRRIIEACDEARDQLG